MEWTRGDRMRFWRSGAGHRPDAYRIEIAERDGWRWIATARTRGDGRAYLAALPAGAIGRIRFRGRIVG